MPMITLTSANGAPGVTTTALALAVSWPRPVFLLEADPSGGSALLAGFWRGTRDRAGVVELVKAHRAGLLAQTLLRTAMPIEGSQASVIVGARSHEQAAGLARLWEPLTGVVRDLAARDQDVIVDAGRLGMGSSPTPLIDQADMTLLVARSGLPAIAGARSWARALAEGTLPGHEVRVLLVGDGRPYKAAEIGQALGVAVIGSIVWDPERAAVFSDGAARPAPQGVRRLVGGPDAAETAFASSGYQRSVQSAGEAIRAALNHAERESIRGIVPPRQSQEDGRERA